MLLRGRGHGGRGNWRRRERLRCLRCWGPRDGTERLDQTPWSITMSSLAPLLSIACPCPGARRPGLRKCGRRQEMA